jgi:hypothetical protein
MRFRIVLLVAAVAGLTCTAQDLQQNLRDALVKRDQIERRMRELKSDMAELVPIQAKANNLGQNLKNKRGALENSFDTWMDVFMRNNPGDPKAEEKERAAVSIDKSPDEAGSTTVFGGIMLDALKQLEQARAAYYAAKDVVKRELQQDSDLRNVRSLGTDAGTPVEPIREPDEMMPAVAAVRARLNADYANADRDLSECLVNIMNLERKIRTAAVSTAPPSSPSSPAVDLGPLNALEQSIAAGEADLGNIRGMTAAACTEAIAKTTSATEAEKAASTALNVLRGLLSEARGKTNSCTSRSSQVAELLAIQGKLAGWESQISSRIAAAQAAAASCVNMTSPEAASKAISTALGGLAACAALKNEMMSQVQIANQRRAQLQQSLVESKAIFVSLAQANPIADIVTGMADTVPGLSGNASNATQRAITLKNDYDRRRSALVNLTRDFKLPTGAGSDAASRLSNLRIRAGAIPGMVNCSAAADAGAGGRAVAMKAEAERLRGEAVSLSSLCRVQGDPITDFTDSTTYIQFLVSKGGEAIQQSIDKCRVAANPSQTGTGQNGRNNDQSGSGTSESEQTDSDTAMQSNGATDGAATDMQSSSSNNSISLGGVSIDSSGPAPDPVSNGDADERQGLNQAMTNAATAPAPQPTTEYPPFDPQAAAAEAEAQQARQAQRAQQQQQLLDAARNLGQMIGQTIPNRRASSQPPPMPSRTQAQTQAKPPARSAGTPVSEAEKGALEAEINQRHKTVWVKKYCAARGSGCSILPDGVRANLVDVWLWEAKTREEVNAVRNLFQCSDGCVMSGQPVEQIGTCLQQCKESRGYKR